MRDLHLESRKGTGTRPVTGRGEQQNMLPILWSLVAEFWRREPAHAYRRTYGMKVKRSRSLYDHRHRRCGSRVPGAAWYHGTWPGPEILDGGIVDRSSGQELAKSDGLNLYTDGDG